MTARGRDLSFSDGLKVDEIAPFEVTFFSFHMTKVQEVSDLLETDKRRLNVYLPRCFSLLVRLLADPKRRYPCRVFVDVEISLQLSIILAL